MRATADAFAAYAEAVVRRLADRVANWFTVNEMPCFIGNGYGNGSSPRAVAKPARGV